jgi:hypothetical protein
MSQTLFLLQGFLFGEETRDVIDKTREREHEHEHEHEHESRSDF